LIFLVLCKGYITVDELREVLSRLNQNVSEHRITEVLREIDTDRDGKISYDEFVHMLQEV
jgi:Ca2+-binding EF-hand superfamily protein